VAQAPKGWWPEVTKDRDDAWYVWSALAVAEGSISKRKITSGDVASMEKAIAMLPSVASARRYDFDPRHSHVPDWFLSWDEFWDEMPVALSNEKQIPQWVFTSSREKARLFMRWLYQGDGWASGHVIGYATTSYKLCKQIITLLHRLGIRSSYSSRPADGAWREQHWVVISKSEDVARFIREIGIEGKDSAIAKVLAISEIRLLSLASRGKAFLKNGLGSIWRSRNISQKDRISRITKKVDVGEHDVYDITVEGEHRFLAGTALVSNCDEEVPQKLFETLQYRIVDVRGKILLTFTTLAGWTPLVADLMSKVRDVKLRYSDLVKRKIPVVQDCLTRAACRIYYWWTTDNPFVPREDFVKSLAGRPESEVLARAHGIPTRSGVSPFPTFDERVHVVPSDAMPWLRKVVRADGKVMPPEVFTRYMAIDPAGSKSWFMLWVAVDAQKRVWVYREWPSGVWGEAGDDDNGKGGPAMRPNGFGIGDYVRTIKALEDGEVIFDRLIDPRMGQAEMPSAEGTTNIITLLHEAGLQVVPAPGLHIDHGLTLINEALSWNRDEPMGPTNTPHLFISEDCPNLIEAMKNLPANASKTCVWKDPVDVLRYILEGGADHVTQEDLSEKHGTFSY
jgi:hypothetical protein